MNQNSISDMLMIGVDFSPNDEDTVVIFRKQKDGLYVINEFRNSEAVELYKKLIGDDKLCLKDGLLQVF